MSQNILNALVKELKKSSVTAEFNHSSSLPKKIPKIKLPKGTNSLGYFKPARYPKNLLEEITLSVSHSNIKKTSKILKKLGFSLFEIRPKYKSYYLFDSQIGLFNLRLTPDSGSLKTKNFSPLLKGRLICFAAPEGGGKTSTLSAVYTVLQNFPISRESTTFSTFSNSRKDRALDLIKKISQVYKNKASGKITLLDRYLFLTFRRSPLLRKILFSLAPKPDHVFIMKAPYSVLKKRRGPLCKPKKEVESLYSLFYKAERKTTIDTTKPIEKNLEIIVNKILRMYNNE
tara:strand:+ start:1531 stop:2391 length:861 start_codon:yes stop_codon:yes gene_type:complete